MRINEKAFLMLGFFYFVINVTFGQDQKLADSLVVLYNSGSYEEDELVILANIAIEETNLDKKMEFSDLLISKASMAPSYNYLYQGYLQKGNALQFKGNNA